MNIFSECMKKQIDAAYDKRQQDEATCFHT